MTLTEFRKKFVELSGRYDLVEDTTNYADDGANFYIRAGNRLLDSMFTHSKSFGVTTFTLTPGTGIYKPTKMLSIEGMQIKSVDQGVSSLSHITEEDLQLKQVSEGTGIPSFYAIKTSLSSPFDAIEVVDLQTLAFELYPYPDAAYELKVYGRVSIPLPEEASVNFWTLNYPETLISATYYQIERFHRNRQGMEDHMSAIRVDLRELDFNAIESQLGSIDQVGDLFEYRGKGNAR